jgi:hypothetical protein
LIAALASQFDAGLAPWQSCDTAAWQNGAGGHDYENLERQLMIMRTFALLRFASSADWRLCPRSSKKHHCPIKKSHAQKPEESRGTAPRKKSGVLKLLNKIQK